MRYLLCHNRRIGVYILIKCRFNARHFGDMLYLSLLINVSVKILSSNCGYFTSRASIWRANEDTVYFFKFINWYDK